MTMIASAAIIASTFAQNAQGFFLDEAAAKTGAVCLDGTPGAYYLSPGSGDGASKWYIHHQGKCVDARSHSLSLPRCWFTRSFLTSHVFVRSDLSGGGWCRSPVDCLGRSVSTLGSSKDYPKTETDSQMAGQSGAMSRDAQKNPMMFTWNHVHIRYCDGNSFTGNNASSTHVTDPSHRFNDSTLYWRGSLILDAVIDSLIDNPIAQLNKAAEVVVGGGSAGGLATIIHCDRWADRIASMNAGTKYACLADSGFFLDHEGPPKPPRFPLYGYHAGMKWAYQQQNSSVGVQKDCYAAHAKTGDAWMCNFAQHTASFNKAPLFARQSTYDSVRPPAHASSRAASALAPPARCGVAAPRLHRCARPRANGFFSLTSLSLSLSLSLSRFDYIVAAKQRPWVI